MIYKYGVPAVPILFVLLCHHCFRRLVLGEIAEIKIFPKTLPLGACRDIRYGVLRAARPFNFSQEAADRIFTFPSICRSGSMRLQGRSNLFRRHREQKLFGERPNAWCRVAVNLRWTWVDPLSRTRPFCRRFRS